MTVKAEEIKVGAKFYLAHPLSDKVLYVRIKSIDQDVVTFTAVKSIVDDRGYVQLLVHNLFHNESDAADAVRFRKHRRLPKNSSRTLGIFQRTLSLA